MKDHAEIAIFFGRPERSHILAEQLRARGFKVVFYNHEGIPESYVPARRAFLPAFFLLLSTHHDVYLTNVNFAASMALYLNRLLRGLPYIFNAVGLMSAMVGERSRKWPVPYVAERWLYPFMWERVLAGTSCIVCNSEYLRRRLEREFPRYAPKMVTIYNGIEFERFASGRPKGASSEGPRLLSVMTWNYEGKTEGAKLLIDAMGPIVERYGQASLIMAVKTSRERYARGVELYLAGKPWRESIRILYNRADIPDLLASSDVFLYATPADSNDSLPRVLLEAQAAGLVAVTTATAGCAEVVEDGVSGYVVPYHAGVLAARVMELLEDAGKREEMGRRGRERVRDLFSWERMGEAYAGVLSRILSDSDPLNRAVRGRDSESALREIS